MVINTDYESLKKELYDNSNSSETKPENPSYEKNNQSIDI